MDHQDLPRTQSLFPMETCPQVSDEAFNLFHSIDRELYTRLILNLGRDPAESVQVMAFWMWLERECNDMNMIRRMLSLPLALLSGLADESAACLKCVENDRFQFGDEGKSGKEITLLPELLSSPVVSLRFFHENRIAVIRGVSKIVNTVCARAFSDILQRALAAAAYQQPESGAGGGINAGPAGSHVGLQFVAGGVHEVGESSREAERRTEDGDGAAPPPVLPILYHPYLNVPFVPLPPSAAGHGLLAIPPAASQQPPVLHPPPAAATEGMSIPVHLLQAAAGSFSAYDFSAQRQMLNNELGEMLSRSLSIKGAGAIDQTSNANKNNNGDDQDQAMPADDRTIFLTFSKGYPISPDEVREYFTRRFGEFIEDLIMQEVGEDEQVLYARMVARSPGVIESIVGGNKAKYSINGKHVWARKYVKKQNQQSSPPRGNSSSSSSPSSSSTAAPREH